ncbi:MAG: hypothetical protein QXF12_06570 [Candidatus Aenigmatarchaeota archaeon]
MIINGLVFDRVALSNVTCITFKRSNVDTYQIHNSYLHIRTTGDRASDILNIPGINSVVLGAYDPNRFIDWGFFFVHNRETYINGFNIKSNVLRDNTTIISLLIDGKFDLIDQTGNKVNVIVYAFEDYIFIVRNTRCTSTQFINAMLSINNFLLNPVLLHGLHPNPFPYGLFEVTLAGSNQQMFTTFSLVPEWRYSAEYRLESRGYVHVHEYYPLEIDFKDYFNVLLTGLENVTKFKCYHKSENIKALDNEVAFITYKVEYQDKSVNAIYMDVGMFETHKYYTAKVQFTFQTTDFFIYRGFINQFWDQRRITNQLGEVCYTPPNGLEYCATVKWSLDEPSYEVQNDFQEIESERGYYHYTLDFAAEMYYLSVRYKLMESVIEDAIGYLTEPHPIRDCNSIRNSVEKLIYNVTSSGVNVNIPPGTDVVII